MKAFSVKLNSGVSNLILTGWVRALALTFHKSGESITFRGCFVEVFKIK
uniref:Uncharacterized protein n=1 Tax=Anguilla anguilla TaxID=7936 RepID=A0A0E9SKM1_ANGAN